MNFRCIVPDCERTGKYDEDWVQFAVPGTFDKTGFSPQHCYRFLRNYSVSVDDKCVADMFTADRERCDKWIFDDGERTIVNDVSLI